MMEVEWLDFVTTTGVPAAIAFLVLLRIDKTLLKIGEALNNLAKIIEHCPHQKV